MEMEQQMKVSERNRNLHGFNCARRVQKFWRSYGVDTSPPADRSLVSRRWFGCCLIKGALILKTSIIILQVRLIPMLMLCTFGIDC